MSHSKRPQQKTKHSQPTRLWLIRHAEVESRYQHTFGGRMDMNLVMNSAGEFIEVQGTGEEATFTEAQLADLLALGKAGIRELLAAQEKALLESKL